MHHNAAWHTPVLSEKLNEMPANCVSGAAYDEIDVCSVDGCDYIFPTYHVIVSELDENNHVNTVDVPESDSTETEHGYTAGVYCNDCKQYISGHEEKPLLVPEEPITEPDEPTTEPVTEPQPTAPATDPTKPTTEPATEPTITPAAPTGVVHGARCFCYTYTGDGLMVNIVRFICAVYNFLWNLRDAVI